MIAIPNMDKPKSCLECWSGLAIVINCEAGTGFHNPDGDLIPPDCPLIEIDLVRCGECKWFIEQGEGNVGKCKYRTRPILYCLPTDFCSYGERKPISDERLEFWKKVYKEVSR